MNAVFLKILNMSITASWLILAAIAVRFLLKKAPKWISCLLWAIVAIKLICPFSIESAFSLIPGSEPVPMDIEIMTTPSVDIGIPVLNEPVNKAISENLAPKTENSANPMQIAVYFLARIWIVGATCLIVYAVISYLKIKRTVSVSIELSKGVKACDDIRSPFILGLINPVIYVPSSLKGESLDMVLMHEHAHLLRKDHWWKPVGFFLLSVYWFNPLCWIAYIMLCRDIESACDEKVIRDMEKTEIAAYSQALLDCNFSRRTIAACPLAFGEVGVKDRIKGILNYKKPAFWFVCIAIVICIVVGIFFLTNPRKDLPVYEQDNPVIDEPPVSEVLSEPPILTVMSAGSAIELRYGSASWNCIDENGNGIAFEADAPHPLFSHCPDLTVFPDAGPLAMSFAVKPDSTEVSYWSDRYINDESGYEEYTKAEYDPETGKVMLPTEEGLIVEVTGKWEYGYACYVFHTQPLFLEQDDDTLGIYDSLTNPVRVIDDVDMIERDFEYGNSKGKLCAYLNRGVYTEGSVETVDIILEDNDHHAVWTEMIGTPHLGWDAYYYYRENDTDYLIEYYPNESQGMIAYSFKMFSVDESGRENVVREYYAYSPEETDAFNEAVKPYMDKAVLFISTINGVIHTGQ